MNYFRRVSGILVSRSFDVTEEGIEGVLFERNPDAHDWLQEIEEEREKNNSLRESKLKEDTLQRQNRIWKSKIKMTSVPLTSDSEIDTEGVDNAGFEVETDAGVEEKQSDINSNFYSNLSTDGPAALDPNVKFGANNGGGDFPGDDFWAGCRATNLVDWVKSVKSEPCDKVQPCVVNQSVVGDHKVSSTKKMLDIVDPVMSADGKKVLSLPPEGTFSFINTVPRVPESGQAAIDCNQCMDPKRCCTNIDEGTMNNWFWFGLIAFLVIVILIVAIVVGVRGEREDG